LIGGGVGGGHGMFWESYTVKLKTKMLNSVAVVRKRTIPTKRPPLVGKVSANFCR
jgi:hypothetical protein